MYAILFSALDSSMLKNKNKNKNKNKIFYAWY